MEYTIGKRTRTNFLDDRGIAVDGYRVYYTMADGTIDYVEVEKNQFFPEIVRAAIEAEIEKHEQLIS